jgi:hypothetical protein
VPAPPLLLRLSGTKWSFVRGGVGVDINGVTITGPSTALAITHTEDLSEAGRWASGKWTWQYPVSQQAFYVLEGIAAGPGGAAFAAGFGYNPSAAPAILKLSGTKWTPTTVKASSRAQLNAITFAPGGTAWAAGSAGRSLIMRWTGYGWAVGTTGPASSPKTLILHWNGSSWK